MEENEATPDRQTPTGKDKVSNKLIDQLFEKMIKSITVEPVEGEVAVTKKVTLDIGSDVTFYVADEHSEKVAKYTLQLLSIKFASDMVEALSNPEKFVELFAH